MVLVTQPLALYVAVYYCIFVGNSIRLPGNLLRLTRRGGGGGCKARREEGETGMPAFFHPRIFQKYTVQPLGRICYCTIHPGCVLYMYCTNWLCTLYVLYLLSVYFICSVPLGCVLYMDCTSWLFTLYVLYLLAVYSEA